MTEQWKGKVAIVTGGGRGIGRALSRQLAGHGASVVVADIDRAHADSVAEEFGGVAVGCDVRRESDIQAAVALARKHFGKVDLFCSNAGIGRGQPDHAASAPNQTWQDCWEVHVMAHVYAARAVLPEMLDRGSGWLLQTCSAAGLLSQIGDAAYSATKHAAVGFAESLAIAHGDQGITVSALCPQYVATSLIGMPDNRLPADDPEVLAPDTVASLALEGLAAGRFLILPHPQVERYLANKTADYDGWLAGMRRLRDHLADDTGYRSATPPAG